MGGSFSFSKFRKGKHCFQYQQHSHDLKQQSPSASDKCTLLNPPQCMKAWRERQVESYGNCSLLYFVSQDHYKSIKMRCFYTFVKEFKKLHTSVLVSTSPSVSGLPLLPVQCLALEAQHSHISPGLTSSAPFLQPVSKALCYTLIQAETIMDCTSSRSQGLQPYSLPNPSHVTPNTFLTIFDLTIKFQL